MSLATTAEDGPSGVVSPRWRPRLGPLDRLVRRPPVVLGLATGVAAAVFVVATPHALPLLAGLLTTLAVGLIGPSLALVGVRGRVRFAADRCRVGDRVGFTSEVMRCGRIVPGSIRVEWPAAQEATNATGAVVPGRRGMFPREHHPPVIASDWPFGIVTLRRRLEVARRLVVRPLTRSVRFPPGLVAARRAGRDLSTGLSGTAGDIIGVRDHRPGDTSRSIHWPQTARRGEVVVCERPGAAAARVRILFCGDRQRGGRDATRPLDADRLDAAVAVAASLLESWSARGADIEVAWFRPDGTIAAFRPRNHQTLDEALDAIACLEVVAPCPASPAGRDLTSRLSAAVDLEVLLLLADGPPPAPTAPAARRILVGFAATPVPDVITLPVLGAAAALDRVFAENGCDPDIR